jgi:hypothetical protein
MSAIKNASSWQQVKLGSLGEATVFTPAMSTPETTALDHTSVSTKMAGSNSRVGLFCRLDVHAASLRRKIFGKLGNNNRMEILLL